jgi:hypothetical protein
MENKKLRILVVEDESTTRGSPSLGLNLPKKLNILCHYVYGHNKKNKTKIHKPQKGCKIKNNHK